MHHNLINALFLQDVVRVFRGKASFGHSRSRRALPDCGGQLKTMSTKNRLSISGICKVDASQAARLNLNIYVENRSPERGLERGPECVQHREPPRRWAHSGTSIDCP
jgi:hypothetical protein